jgi:hypothetical protein
MPRVMIAYSNLEFVVTPDITFVLMSRDHDFNRHIYTDGRDYPANMAQEPRFLGYSIGKWLDEDGDGRYDVLTVETRGLKGPRVFDATGIPLQRTTRPSSRSASISTRPIRTCCTTTSPPSTMP